MAIAKWAAPGSRSANLAGAILNAGITNGSASAFISYDNSTARDLYAIITLRLGSFTPGANPSVLMRLYSGDGADLPDINGGAFDSYVAAIAAGAGAKIITFPMIRLYPFPLRLQFVNNSGQTWAASGNEVYLTPFNEDVT